MSISVVIFTIGILGCVPLTMGCTYNGMDYTIGDKFQSIDGCNECVCGAIGVVCTKMMCLPATTDSISLKPCSVTAGGITTTYADGQSFKASDGCNTCVCTNGVPRCTLMACLNPGICTDPTTGKTYNEGDSFPSSDGCNTCNCQNSAIACTEMACSPKGSCYDRIMGNLYESGDVFNAPDGCNTCTCTNGVLSCTKKICNLA